jgi:hypothetical protein
MDASPPPPFLFVALGSAGFIASLFALLMAWTRGRDALPLAVGTGLLGIVGLAIGAQSGHTLAGIQAGAMPVLAGGIASVVALRKRS